MHHITTYAISCTRTYNNIHSNQELLRIGQLRTLDDAHRLPDLFLSPLAIVQDLTYIYYFAFPHAHSLRKPP